jgi:hypothetical protein
MKTSASSNIDNLARDLQAVHARQHQVQQQDIWRFRAHHLERLPTVRAQAHGVTRARQVVAQRVEEALLIFDDQHIGHVTRPLSSFRR